MQETWVLSLVTKSPWRREWQPSPVFLPEECHGQRSLVGYSPRGCKESDTTAQLTHTHTQPRGRIVCVPCSWTWRGWHDCLNNNTVWFSRLGHKKRSTPGFLSLCWDPCRWRPGVPCKQSSYREHSTLERSETERGARQGPAIPAFSCLSSPSLDIRHRGERLQKTADERSKVRTTELSQFPELLEDNKMVTVVLNYYVSRRSLMSNGQKRE